MDEGASIKLWRDYRTLIEGAIDDALADEQLRAQLSECRAMLAAVRAHDPPHPDELTQTWRHLVAAVERFRRHAPALDTGFGVYLCLLLVMWEEAVAAPAGGGASAGADTRRLIPARLRPLLTDDPLILHSSPQPKDATGRAGRRNGHRAARMTAGAGAAPNGSR